MTNEDNMNEALGVFEEMNREDVYVSIEAEEVIFEFGRYEFNVDLWNGSRCLYDREENREVFSTFGGH